jgi:hypothetical protein
MKVKASAAGALMLAAGLFVSIAGPSPATAAGSESAAASNSESAPAEKSSKSSSRDLKNKRHAYRKHSRTAAKSAETGKAAEKADADAGTRPALSESVANANAQMNSADAARGNIGDSAKAMSQAMAAKANTILLAAADNQADGQAPAEGAAVAAPDQLNDVDKALQESESSQTAASQTNASQTAASQTVAMGQARPAQQDNPAQVSGSDSLDKTSLIGKIFIAFGTLLTMASAARMFMA